MTTVENLEKAIREVAERERAYGDAVQNEAETEYSYKIAQATEYLKADGTVDERKAIALTNCKTQYKAYLTAQATKAFCDAKLKDAQSAMNARQSLLRFQTQTNFGEMRTGA